MDFPSLKPSPSTISFWLAVLTTCVIKLLFLKSYRSTDFEVHRNWLAITHSLPLEKWYYEETSEWTLDYPPFFAYFEWTLSQAAQIFDAEMLQLKNLSYASNSTVLFQKGTVILTDFVLAYGVQTCANGMKYIHPSKSRPESFLMEFFALIFINGGLFMVDHIHFQYNGFLFGILLLSIGKIVQGRCYQGAFLFAALLNFKHIFLYMAPAFGIFLLRKYCIRPESRGIFKIRLGNLCGFGSIVLTVFAVSFAPFYQHIPQILKRLFPFKRGLSHAYWAPNFWAAYNSLDLVLNYGLKQGKSGATSGLVGESQLAVLPQVQPLHTFILTLIVMMPSLYKLWISPTEKSFIYAVIINAWTSFMFGYHVHEKAILNVIIPFSLIAFDKPRIYFISLVAGTVSLFPLLFTPFEIIFKALITIFHVSLCSIVLVPSIKWFELAYLAGFVPVYLFENLGYLIIPTLPFLPLLAMSDYCWIGVTYCFCWLYWEYVSDKDTSNVQKQSPQKPKTPKSNRSKGPTTPTPLSSRILRPRK